MAKKKRVIKEKNLGEKDDKKLFAFLATFLSIIGFVIALAVKRKDSYVMYYAKHSLIIFCLMVIAGFIGKVFLIIPIAGDIINGALVILSIIVWGISWIYSLSGERKDIPIITNWAEKIKL